MDGIGLQLCESFSTKKKINQSASVSGKWVRHFILLFCSKTSLMKRSPSDLEEKKKGLSERVGK